jgi:hypothetical protein
VTGFVISINKTPIKFYSKRQNTVESSSYGSELVAGRIATEAIMEYRYKLRMLGIDIDSPAILLIDNQSVVANTTLPSSTIKKKHNSIAYHRMREAVAAGIIKVGFIKSTTNLADILTKPIGPADYWRLLTEPLYGRDRAIEGELQGITRAASRSAKTPPKSELNSATQEQVAKLGKPSRYRVTLYVESHGTPEHERDSDGIETDESRTESELLLKMVCTVCKEVLGSESNGDEPRENGIEPGNRTTGSNHGDSRRFYANT